MYNYYVLLLRYLNNITIHFYSYYFIFISFGKRQKWHRKVLIMLMITVLLIAFFVDIFIQIEKKQQEFFLSRTLAFNFQIILLLQNVIFRVVIF